jgi:hypothetical protein
VLVICEACGRHIESGQLERLRCRCGGHHFRFALSRRPRPRHWTCTHCGLSGEDERWRDAHVCRGTAVSHEFRREEGPDHYTVHLAPPVGRQCPECGERLAPNEMCRCDSRVVPAVMSPGEDVLTVAQMRALVEQIPPEVRRQLERAWPTGKSEWPAAEAPVKTVEAPGTRRIRVRDDDQ